MASSNADIATPVSFPFPPREGASEHVNSTTTPQRRSRTSTLVSSTSSRIRSASLKLMEANPPPGMWAATGAVASKAPTLAEIRSGSFGSAGRQDEPRKRRAQTGTDRDENGRSREEIKGSLQTRTPDSPPKAGSAKESPKTTDTPGAEPFPTLTEEELDEAPLEDRKTATFKDGHREHDIPVGLQAKGKADVADGKEPAISKRKVEVQYSNGYIPPPKVPWTQTATIGLKAFSKWSLTPAGFLITIYGLNVVAWGGMLFLLLCNAAPAMCNPTCDDIQSPRRIWIEIDSQILNALFCVTGFGLAPWRFRDLYWWAWWRCGGVRRSETGIRRLAGIHRGWFRLPGSDALPSDASAKTVNPDDPAVPIPVEKIPDPPLTGIHAPPTKSWKMDFVLWMNAWNTFFQVVLGFYMWHYNRHDRPSWATGLFVALGCIVAGVGGITIYHEGKCVKKVEGAPIPAAYKTEAADAATNA